MQPARAEASRAPHLYVLCGMPFSGKSTLARELASRLGLVHVELDQVNAERAIGQHGEPITKEDWIISYREAHRRVDEQLAAGRAVIFDATSFRRLQRDRLRRIARGHATKTTVIHVDVPEEEARRRLEHNRLTRQRGDVRDEDFAQVIAGWQPPDIDEDAVRYDPSRRFDEWIQRLTADIEDGSE